MMRGTPADIFALRVDTSAILTGLWTLAFVYVGAIAAGAIQFVAFVAFAAEHTENVLAASEYAQITKHLAFVNVHARLLVALIRMHKTHLALAAISTRIVQTMPIFTQCDILRALVDVLATVAIASEAGIAHTLQKSPVLTK